MVVASCNVIAQLQWRCLSCGAVRLQAAAWQWQQPTLRQPPPPPPAFRRYGTFILARKQPGGDKMRGFTRILHRTKLDAPVSDEVGRWLPREGSLQASSNVPQAPSARRLGPMQ